MPPAYPSTIMSSSSSSSVIAVDAQNHLDASVNDLSNQSPPRCNGSITHEFANGDQQQQQPQPEQYNNGIGKLQFLSDKLSAALLNITLKDDLITQHSTAAEEALAGWEKAEEEVTSLKQQLESALETKSSLEARVTHLDEALKECVRQLRLGRDDQQRKIDRAVAEKTKDLETVNSKLEFLERENVALREQLQSQSEELEVRTIERDLSTRAAETASKQNLESIKNMAKLEAECRKLKPQYPRMSPFSNDHRLTQAASSYSESLSDSHSDGADQLNALESDTRKLNGWASALVAELDQFKSDKAVDRGLHTSIEINLMDDFLEMERLAALPQVPVGCNQTSEKPEHEMESKLRAELDFLVDRITDLEENLSRAEMDKVKLEDYINRIELEKREMEEYISRVEADRGEMEELIRIVEAEKGELEEVISKVEAEKGELEMALDQTQRCLENSDAQLMEAHIRLEWLETGLKEANQSEQHYKTLINSREHEAELMSFQIKSLRAAIDSEHAVSEELSSRCKELEDALSKKEEELVVQQDSFSKDKLKIKEKTLGEAQDCLEKSQAELKGAQTKLKELENEVDEAHEEKKFLSSELDGVRAEVKAMCTQIESLNQQVIKEQVLVAELSIKVKELESELQEKTQELNDAQQSAYPHELKIKQEDLTEAAGKLVDCQKTIASLGNQLKSLATLEDFLIDTASISGLSPPAPLMGRRSGEPWRFHSNSTFFPEKGVLEPLSPAQEGFSPFASHDGTTLSSGYYLNHPGLSERNENGFGNYSLPRRN